MFSLIDEPWILAVDTEGARVEVGLKDVFSGEVKIHYLQGESPAQNFAILRLLLAIFWRAHVAEVRVAPGQTFEFSRWFKRLWRKLRETGRDDVVLQYLEEHRDRFDLVSPGVPFMQVADLHVPSGEIKPVSTIVPEAQGDYFTMRAGKARESLTLAEAARWLVYAQAFDYSGIKSGMVGDSRVKGGRGYPIGTGWSGMTGCTVIKGNCLLETLLFNTTSSCLTKPGDRAAWERRPDSADARSAIGEKSEPQGPADLATWQSRRIRLIASDTRVVGVVLGNGDKIPAAGANVLDDPMTPYRYSKNKSKVGSDVYYPRPYDAERTMWKSLEPLVMANGDLPISVKEKPPKRPETLSSLAELSQAIDGIPDVFEVELSSIEYGSQASSVARTVAASVSIPVILLLEGSKELRDAVRNAASTTTQSAIALGQFAGQLHTAAGGDYEFQPPVTDRALAELEPDFNAWLASLSCLSEVDGKKRLDDLLGEWEGRVRSLVDAHARILLRGAGPRALVGRIETDKEGNHPRMVSAASYYQLLQRKLNEYLPRTNRKVGNEEGIK